MPDNTDRGLPAHLRKGLPDDKALGDFKRKLQTVFRDIGAELADLAAVSRVLDFQPAEDDIFIGTFPDDGAIFARKSGLTTINVRDGSVLLQSQTAQRLTQNLKELNRNLFRSMFIYCDQPAQLIIDGRGTIPLRMGINRIPVTVREKIDINCYMPHSLSVVFSTGREPPIHPLTASFPFMRAANINSTNSFRLQHLRPINFNYSVKPTPDGTPLQNTIFSDTLNEGEEGPFTANLKKISFFVQNEGSNSLTFKLQAVGREGEAFNDMGITGASGIEVPAGDAAQVDIEDEYVRIQMAVKSTVSGSATTGSVAMTGRFGS